MIEVEIVPCEPHRAFHGLILVHGLRRRPVSARFSILSQDEGRTRYLGPGGWDTKFAECRNLAAGWDVERRILWVIISPEVTLLLDEGPFTFTLLQTGEQVPDLTLPEAIREPGDGELPVVPPSSDKTSIPMIPVPISGLPEEPMQLAATRPRAARAASERPQAPAPQPAPVVSAPPPKPVQPVAAPRPQPKPVTMAATTAASAANETDTPPITPHKDAPVKPVVIAIALFLAAAMGVAYLLSDQSGDKVAATTQPAVVAQAPPPAVPVQPVVTAPAPVPPPPPAPAPAAEPAPAPHPEPAASVAPAPVVVVAPPAPPPPVVAAPAPRPAPTGPRCGAITNPGSLSELPTGTASADAVCVARLWIKSGRTDDAVGALSVSPHSDYPPAMLELAKLYDPKSNFANPPASADFAREQYRKAIQKTDDEAIRKEAQQRLDALPRR